MIIKKRIVRFCWLLFLCVSVQSFSQLPEIKLSTYKEKYKGEDVVYLKYNEYLFIEPKNEELNIDDKTENSLLFLTESSTYYAQQKISHVQHVSDIDEIDAYTLVPKEKGGYKKVRVDEFTKSSNTSEDVFYDDVNTTSFFFPQPNIGAIGVLNYTEKIKDPHFLSRFFFAAGHPVEEATFSIKVHKSVDLKFVLRNPANDIVFTDRTEGNFKVYTWTRRNIEKLKAEDNAKSIAYETPHLIIYIASYQGKTANHKVLPDTRGLYDYCYSLLDKGIEAPDAELLKVIDSVTNGAKTPLEKVKRVYDYIQESIHYIAFEDGLGGFIPRKPNLVCNRKYGDCKDIANLICTMLNQVGVPAYHTWVGTQSIPYKFSEYPIMGVANHMIAAVRIEDKWYFLDGTAKFLSLKYPSGFIQGKQAMIGISKDSFLLVDIPVVDANTNITKHELQVSFNGDTLQGTGHRMMDGLSRCNIISEAYYVPEKKRNEFWENYLELAQNNCKLDQIEITGLNGRDSVLNFRYHFKVPKYVTHFEDEVYVNMNLLKIWNSGEIQIETRSREMMFDETYTTEIVSHLNIPEGYEISKLPANASCDKGKFKFVFTYEQRGNTIVYTQKYIFNTLELNKPDFKPWNELIQQVQKAYRQTVSLKKKRN